MLTRRNGPNLALKGPVRLVMLSRLYYASLRAIGAPALGRLAHNAGPVLCYHNVVRGRNTNAGDPAVHLPVDKFEAQMRWLVDHYRVVSLGEIVRRLERGRPLRGLAAVTFDDAYQGVFEHAWPLLLEIGIPATVFVVSDPPARREAYWWDHPSVDTENTALREVWLTELRGEGAVIAPVATATSIPASHRPADWETIAAAAWAGCTLGVHSATHRTLTRLSETELAEEVVESWETIRRETGVRAEFFAYPYGRWSAPVRDAVRQAGYRGAVTLDYGLVAPGADPWALRRVNVPAGISAAAFEAWCAGLRPRLRGAA